MKTGLSPCKKITFPAAIAVFLILPFNFSGTGGAGEPASLSRLDLLTGDPAGSSIAGRSWEREDLIGIDDAGDVPEELAGADILALYLKRDGTEWRVRVSMAGMVNPSTGRDLLREAEPEVMVLLDYTEGGGHSLPGNLEGSTSIRWDEALSLAPFGESVRERAGRVIYGSTNSPERPKAALLNRGGEYFEAAISFSGLYMQAAREVELPGGVDNLPVQIEVITVSGGRLVDRMVGSSLAPAGVANCAFVHHGNQGLAYTDVFYGRSDDMDGSGFDEALQVHQSTSMPGNFHLCGPLQTSAEWDNNNGDPNDFNGWLETGVTSGWCGMVSSAYGQHIMPFVQDDMNDWAVNIQTQMTNTRYGYYPRVAWVPERVWLHPSYYPEAGVIDDLVDNWESHGVWAVILDDDVHCQGYDNHQIHTISGSTLKVIPRDRDFTGNIVGGNGSGALQILTDMANSGVGEYRMALYAEDWEAAAEMGSWASSTPNAKETYDWFINKCSAESAWINVWKVADAVSNPDFQGSSSMNITYGTYQEIGGTAGYGGGNNGWYTDWAAYVPYANGGDGYGSCDPGRGGNCKDFGTIWNDAYNALSAAPDNNISQAGWYALMTNLHETGWHDGMGGDISGWQLKYSGHIKNANMYAEAAHWANGEYANTTGAYFSDIDNDGYQEMIIHNDRVYAVFEGIGGRAVNIFARGSDYNFSIVGVDNAYWAGTTADYNDVNHVGAFSDVGPNYQHSLYDMEIESSSGDTVQALLSYQNVSKRVRLVAGEPYLDVVYQVGPSTQYIKTGYSPGLVDLVWNAQMERIWVSDTGYMGQRNPNNGATAALILGGGGGSHNFDFSGRIMKGDEIYSEGVFEFLLYAGKTSAPDPDGEIPELRTLSDNLTDDIGPGVISSIYYPGTDKLKIDFNQVVQYLTFDVTGVSIDDNDDGSPELTLSSGSSVLEASDGYTLTLQLTGSDASALEGLDTSGLELMMSAGTSEDISGNGNAAITNQDDIRISYGAETMITIDGYIDTSEWDGCTLAVPDSLDSDWTSSNELDGIYITRDSVYLYIAIDGRVDSNSWILYLDVDPGSSNGETDLTGIDQWERGATFSYPGFACDFQYGCYQHQGQFDSDSFFEITGPGTTVNLSDSIISAFDSMHDHGDLGGSELAIPWSVLYGMGPGAVPDSASISLVASLCWDPEPDGELGGDSAPSNISASLPEIDNVYTFKVDADGDGVPDLPDHTAPELISAHLDLSSDTLVNVAFSEPLDQLTAESPSNYTVYRTDIPSQTISVLSAQLAGAGDTVQLALDDRVTYGYSLSVSLVADTSCYANQIEGGSSTEIEGPVVTGGDDTPAAGFEGILYQNYPNPFNPSTVIRFQVPGTVEAREVRLDIFDIRGRRVRSLISGKLAPGPHSVDWNGINDRGAAVSSGIYFYRIMCGRWSESRKMVILR
ncbi:MAG: T9SS type A sorting domain-containing protein [Candidatus Latescibacteria bacterium]|nr:T9SS type A sorting domain-containing protein [bacterium]MBD3423427.1 T9SS type A sorting domain-containing protein [Candidatus Latescibacterota bacterium]